MSQDTGRAPRGNARGELARVRLLEAALESFARKGFHGTSTRDIAEAAGMSPAAVYVHYPTKEQLLYELSRAGHHKVRSRMDDAVARHTEPADRLREVVREFAAWHARSQVQARVVQYEMAALDPGHAAEIAALRRDIETLMRRLLIDGHDAGVFRVDDPPMTALAILSLGIDVARWYRPGGEWSPERIGDQYARMALDLVHYAPKAPPSRRRSRSSGA
ncbi:TetR/AcrR family transcriptional regulator [Actinoplanes bogorensis]|uniref:TetR/AcrR family transcriptional regulator n=1 Tax=Paractinoplanes bogorensis TaxID=1610840 RepID=A0ABS5YUS2_9ACTN|nr:TetR/AcrR family transcriptional regulator [Actinoplanes bogorensis]MBU2667198.1 TetR/AcrR family transcriptional regulator [Actinoplanes bogorensis]